MYHISVVANNAFGVVNSWEGVAIAKEEHKLINPEAKEFEQHIQAEEYACSRFITRFLTRNRWREVTIPMPAELPPNKLFIDNEYEQREGATMIDVTPTKEMRFLENGGK